MEGRNSMSVILFTHPASEHIADPRRPYGWDNKLFKTKIRPYKQDSVVMPWNDTMHDRKFIECKCDILNEQGNVETIERQRFWGEWEQPSWVYTIKGPGAKYVHIPLFGKTPDDYSKYQNTDPYVFGDSFYYCCCKQNNLNTRHLKELKENDMIIFCGLIGQNGGNRKFVIDTVFVVKEPVCRYGTKETDTQNGAILQKLDSNYVKGVLDPVRFGNQKALGGGKKLDDYVLYRAKMYNSESLFSYFPVRRDNNYGRVEIPFEKMEKFLKVNENGVRIGNRTQASLHRVDSCDVWNSLKDYVTKQGYLMGIKAYDEFGFYDARGFMSLP